MAAVVWVTHEFVHATGVVTGAYYAGPAGSGIHGSMTKLSVVKDAKDGNAGDDAVQPGERDFCWFDAERVALLLG